MDKPTATSVPSKNSKLWAGRFEKATDSAVDDFHSSLPFDGRLYRQDIQGSIAHATMLGEQGVIPQEDADHIIAGLHGILADIEAGLVDLSGAEDIHMFVEALLIDSIGDAGKRLHTGRSRNDQVALDMRMYMKEGCRQTRESLVALIQTLLNIARAHIGSIMPGYTHLQKAQPVTRSKLFISVIKTNQFML